MAQHKIVGDLYVNGEITCDSMTVPAASVSNASITASAAIARSKLAQDTNQPYKIPWTAWRVHDAFQTNLPGTPATDDLGLVGGTFATGVPSIQTEDLKGAGATNNRARCVVTLPPEYDDGNTITIRAHAGMLTTVADNSATLDFEVYKSDEEAGADGPTDLCATAAQSINSLTLADKDYTITPTGLVPGDELDIRMTTAVNDAASITVVKAIIGAVSLLLDIKG